MTKENHQYYDRAIGVLQRLVKLYNYFRNPNNEGKARNKQIIREALGMDEEYSDKTLERDVKALETYFDIRIKYDQSKKYYHVVQDHQLVPDNNRLNQLFTLCLNLQDAQARLKTVLMVTDTILFEHEDSNLLRSDQFLTLQSAISNHHALIISHKGYEKLKSTKTQVEPVILRQHKKLWYLVAYVPKSNQYKNYGLDRINHVEVLDETFKTKHMTTVKKILAVNYGSYLYDPNQNKTTNFKLKFTGHIIPHIKATKIHNSQIILEETDAYLIILLSLIDNVEFKADLRTYHTSLEILEPENYSLNE